MSDAVNIMRRAASVEKAPLFEPYSKVIIHVGLNDSGDTEITYEAGNDTGRTLEINNEWGTQMMANTILAKIRGYQYQPFSASSALVDPSVELGDGITVNGIYSGIFVQATTFNSLMASDVSAPVDEEIEHEYGFESKTDRAYTRMVAQTRSGISLSAEEIAAEVARATDAEGELSGRITVNAQNITAEVTRATGAESSLSGRITVNAENITAEVRRATQEEGNLSGRITVNAGNITAEVNRATDAEGTLRSSISQNADSITAEVRRATNAEGTKLNHTYSNSSFGWQLTSSAFILKSNNQEVFKANSSGITVKGSGEFTGKITATSGYIGNGSSGFTISNTAIYNGMRSLGDQDNNGVYVGTDGIAIGKGAFKVTSAGAVTATNLSISGGSININDTFKVDSYGNLTAASGTLTNLSITNGSININNKFRVDSSGNLSATSGTFSGNVYAGNIQYGGDYGTFDGSGITAYSISGGYDGQIASGSIWDAQIATHTLTGGYGGNIASGAVYAGSDFTNFASAANSGVFGGYDFKSMTDYPAYYAYPLNASSFRYQGSQLSPRTISFIDGNGNERTYQGVMMYIQE